MGVILRGICEQREERAPYITARYALEWSKRHPRSSGFANQGKHKRLTSELKESENGVLMPRRSDLSAKKLPAAAVPAAMPASVEPMLPMLVQKPFSNADWLFEPKWDGWRTLCFVRDGKVHLVSRKRNSLTERFPELREIAGLISATTAIIDSEIVALDQDGLRIPRRIQTQILGIGFLL